MSLKIKIPFHATSVKAIQNIHMGRDVRSDIPEEEADAIMSLKRNYPVIYEYTLNKFPDKLKDGDEIIFYEEVQEKRGKKTETVEKEITRISKKTTNYLGERARVQSDLPKTESAEPPKEPPKEEPPKPPEPKPEPKKEIVSETGAVEAKAEPVRPPPNPTVPLPVEIAKEDVVDFPVYGDYTGAKVYIQGKRLKTREGEAVYYQEWKTFLKRGLQDYARGNVWAFIGSSGGASFFPVIEMETPQKSIWGELAIEIAGFYKKMKSLKEETAKKTGWDKVKYPIPEDILAKRLAYNERVMSTKNDFNKYLLQKYEVLMPDERPPEPKQKYVVSESGAVKLNPKMEHKIFMPKKYPVLMTHYLVNVRNIDATPDVVAETKEEYIHFIKEGYIFSDYMEE